MLIIIHCGKKALLFARTTLCFRHLNKPKYYGKTFNQFFNYVKWLWKKRKQKTFVIVSIGLMVMFELHIAVFFLVSCWIQNLNRKSFQIFPIQLLALLGLQCTNWFSLNRGCGFRVHVAHFLGVLFCVSRNQNQRHATAAAAASVARSMFKLVVAKTSMLKNLKRDMCNGKDFFTNILPRSSPQKRDKNITPEQHIDSKSQYKY